jgi:hypothetical protein
MIDEEAARKIQLVPLSDNTIQRIQNCASNVLDELVRRLRLSESFTIQLDESTDAVNLSILLVFVRYVYKGEFQEDLLLCKSTEAKITGEDIFQILDKFFINHQIDWNKCIDVCTDGAKSMTGKPVGVLARIKTVSKMCRSSHYILYRYALAFKKMQNSLKSVLDNAVQIICFIKARPLNSRLFKLLYNDMGSEYETLIFRTEFRWLPRDIVLVRVFQLSEETASFFLSAKEASLANYFSDVS